MRLVTVAPVAPGGTWNSAVAQSIGYGEMRQGRPGRRAKFVQVESRMSQTGANSDEWIPCRPGMEGALALRIDPPAADEHDNDLGRAPDRSIRADTLQRDMLKATGVVSGPAIPRLDAHGPR